MKAINEDRVKLNDLKDALHLELASLRIAEFNLDGLVNDMEKGGLQNNLGLICSVIHNTVNHIEKRIA